MKEGELANSPSAFSEKNRPGGWRALPAHLYLDPDRLSLQFCAERPELHHRRWAGHAVVIGGILEIIVALAGIGTAVGAVPGVKRQNEGVALGFVGTRVLEASTIFADVVCLLAIVTLRRAGVGAEALVTGKALVALYGLFRLGQNLMPAVNDLLLGYLALSVAPGTASSCRCWDSSERPCSSLTPSCLCSASPAGRSLR